MTFFGAFLVTLHHFDKLRLEKEIPRTLKLYWLLWNQSIVFATAISIFYWCIPHDDAEINLNNILIHVLNSTVLIFDLFIVNHPANFPSFIYFLPVEFAYLLFTIAYQFLGGVDKWVRVFLHVFVTENTCPQVWSKLRLFSSRLEEQAEVSDSLLPSVFSLFDFPSHRLWCSSSDPALPPQALIEENDLWKTESERAVSVGRLSRSITNRKWLIRWLIICKHRRACELSCEENKFI